MGPCAARMIRWGDESIREKGYLVLGAADGVAIQRLRDLVGAARSRVCSQMIRFPTSLTCSDRPSFCRQARNGAVIAHDVVDNDARPWNL